MVGIVFMILGGIGLGALATYIYLSPKVKTTQNIDIETQRRNEEMRAELLQLTEQHADLLARKETILQSIDEIKKQADEASNKIYEQSLQLANEKMSAAAEKMSAEYEEARKQMEEEYLTAMGVQSALLSKELNSTNIAIKAAETRLADLSSKVNAAIEAAKRQEEMDTAQDFYRLNLSNIDIEEITKLRQVTVLLRDSEPLNKVIWKVYYEKPYTDLIGRVVGSGVHTGIYKITNLENQKCYVGQAVKYWPMKNFTRLLSRVRLMGELTGKFFEIKTIPWEILINPSFIKIKYMLKDGGKSNDNKY